MTKKGAPAKFDMKCTVSSARAMPRDIPSFMTFEERTSVDMGAILGLEASAIRNPEVAKKLLQVVVLPANKKMAGELELDEVTT